MDAPVGPENRGHRRQLDNAGELHEEQSRNLQARARLLLSGATTDVYCMLPRTARARALRLRCRVYCRQGVGSDHNTRWCAVPTHAETRHSLPVLQSWHDRPSRRTRNAHGERPRSAKLLDDY